jgi:hypothetical protein
MEYEDSTKPIRVANIPIGSNDFFFVLRKDFSKFSLTHEHISIKNGLSILEEIFLDIIDILTKRALRKVEHIEFHVAGGKAINNIIKKNYLVKSFDFDIHLEREDDKIPLAKRITDLINLELRQPWNVHIREQIFRKLYKYNFVTERERDYYRDTSKDLIYYGERVKNKFSVFGLFIKLKFQEKLFEDTENTVIKYNNFMINDDTYESNDPHRFADNILYLPFSDIDAESFTKFGVISYNSPYPEKSYITVDGIKYLDFVMLLYNVIVYATTQKYKIDSNLGKIKKIIRSLHTNCTFQIMTDEKKISESLKNIATQILKSTEINFTDGFKETIKNKMVFLYYDETGKKKELFKIQFPEMKKKIIEFLHKVINNYLGFRNNLKKICYTTLHTDKKEITDPLHKNIYKTPLEDNVKDTEIFEELEKLTYYADSANKNLYILRYTSNAYLSVNSYLNLKENSLDSSEFTKDNKSFINYNYTLSNSTTIDPIDRVREIEASASKTDEIFREEFDKRIHINDVSEVEAAVKGIDKVFEEFHKNIDKKDLKGKNIKEYINDTFTTYSFQLVFNYKNQYGTYDNINNLKSGDILIYPQYLSTTWDNAANLSFFAEPTKTLFRITINKNNKNWLFLNGYSNSPREKEILIKRNSIFCVKSNNMTVVNIKGNDYDINIIDLELIDNPIDVMINNIYMKSGTDNYYENPLKSELFKVGADYVYINYLSKEYKDAKTFTEKNIICPSNCLIQSDSEIEFTINGETKTLYRNNHALAHTLRVSSWIYLYGLYLIKDDITLKDIITPKFLLQICVAGLFLITGRDSEFGALDKVDSCEGLTLDEKIFYNKSHARYLEQSANYFEKFIDKLKIRDVIYNNDEIENYKYCMKNYYYIYNEIDNEKHKKTKEDEEPLNKLISKLFYLSHMIDLIRCKSDCEFTVPIKNKADENYEAVSQNIRNLTIELCQKTGDRVWVKNFIDYKNKDRIYSNKISQHYEPFFYENSTEPEICIKTILNIITPHAENLINDIEEILYPYEHKGFDTLKFLDIKETPSPVIGSPSMPPPPVIGSPSMPPPPVIGSPSMPTIPTLSTLKPSPVISSPYTPSLPTLPPPPVIGSPYTPSLPTLPPPPVISSPYTPSLPTLPQPPVIGSPYTPSLPTLPQPPVIGSPYTPSLPTLPPPPLLKGGSLDKTSEDKTEYVETDVEKALLDTENSLIGATIYCPLSMVDYFTKNVKTRVIPFISEFSKINFSNIDEKNDYINKLIFFYTKLKLFEKTIIKIPEKLNKLNIKIINQLTSDEYFRMINGVEEYKISKPTNLNVQTNKEQYKFSKTIDIFETTVPTNTTNVPTNVPTNIRRYDNNTTIQLTNPEYNLNENIRPQIQVAGSYYYEKYLKYKQKYYELKKKLN